MNLRCTIRHSAHACLQIHIWVLNLNHLFGIGSCICLCFGTPTVRTHRNGTAPPPLPAIIFANYIARDTQRLGATIDVEHAHVR